MNDVEGMIRLVDIQFDFMGDDSYRLGKTLRQYSNLYWYPKRIYYGFIWCFSSFDTSCVSNLWNMFPFCANPVKDKEELEGAMSDDRVVGVSFIFMPVMAVVKKIYNLVSSKCNQNNLWNDLRNFPRRT